MITFYFALSFSLSRAALQRSRVLIPLFESNVIQSSQIQSALSTGFKALVRYGLWEFSVLYLICISLKQKKIYIPYLRPEPTLPPTHKKGPHKMTKHILKIYDSCWPRPLLAIYKANHHINLSLGHNLVRWIKNKRQKMNVQSWHSCWQLFEVWGRGEGEGEGN